MKKYRITKYDPQNRNTQGEYLFDHWTEISDVGKILEGQLITEVEYLRIERDYINAVLEILKDQKQEYLRLVSFNKKRFEESLKINLSEWFHELSFENIELFEDKKINIKEIPTVIKLNLRGYLDTTIEIIDKYYIQFGNDFYMYVGTPDLSQKAIAKINSTSVFIEEFQSPYYYPEVEYVIQFSKKDSIYVEGEIHLSVTIKEMKSMFYLSREHPGIINCKIDSVIANQLGVEIDFTKYDCYLRTELKTQ